MLSSTHYSSAKGDTSALPLRIRNLKKTTIRPIDTLGSKSRTRPSTPLSSASEESLPEALLSTDTFSSQKRLPARNPRVLAIIDDFVTHDIPIGSYAKGGIVMTSHGALVEAHARAAAPHLRFLRFQTTTSPKSHAITFPGDALEEVKKALDRGLKIHALNLSSGHEPRISSLQKHYELPELSVENIGEYREQILDELQPHVTQVIDNLEAIARACPVYASAGNHGNNTFNLYLFAKGVAGVGAENHDHQPEAFSANHRWVSEWGANGKIAIPAKRKGASGFQLIDPADLKQHKSKIQDKSPKNTKDKTALPFVGNRVDLPWSDTTCIQKRPEDFPNEEWLNINAKAWTPNHLHGTSFAAPDKAATYTRLGKKPNPFLSFVKKKTPND